MKRSLLHYNFFALILFCCTPLVYSSGFTVKFGAGNTGVEYDIVWKDLVDVNLSNNAITRTALARVTEGLVPDNIEFAALKAIYDSLNGPNWTTKTNWPTPGNWPATATATQMGTWYGVKVIDGDVSELLYTGNNMAGRLPASIGNLTSLKALRFDAGYLTGPIPSSVNQLVSLKYLMFGWQPLMTGAIPDLSALTQLETFSLRAGSGFTPGPVPGWLTTLPLLKRIDLNATRRTGTIPSGIGNLTNLLEIDLSVNQLSGTIPVSFGNISNLTILNLGHNQLSGSIPTELCNLPKLVSLYLNNNQLSGAIPADIGNLPKLEFLHLRTNQLTGSIPNSICNIVTLKLLNLGTNQLSSSIPENIGNMTLLNQLYLDVNQLTGAVPSSIGNLTNLGYLYLASNQLSGPLPAAMGALNPAYFNISNNQFTGEIPASFSNFSNVILFWIGNNAFSGMLPSNLFANWTKVTNLFVSSNNFSGPFPAIGSSVALVDLHGNVNKFTSLPPSILNLPAATTINFDSNDLKSIPNFTTHANKANLGLSVLHNYLDFGSIEPNFSAPGTPVIRDLAFNIQKPYNEVTDLVIPGGHPLHIQARDPGPHGSVKWEYRASPTAAWVNFNSQNEDATQRTLHITSFNTSKAGQYRYTLTNTWMPNVSLASVIMNISAGHYPVEWVKLKNVTVNDGALAKTAPDAWNNTGADASNLLPALTDGWIEFTTGPASGNYIIGLATSGKFDQAGNLYGINISGNDVVTGENGLFTAMGTQQPGDVFRITRAGAEVRYSKNGTVVRTTTADPKLNLTVKAVIYSGTSPKVLASFDVKPKLEPVFTTLNLSGTGGIAVTAVYGKSPYGYTWSEGTNGAAISGKPVGTYTVTAIDALGRITSVPYDLGYAVNWTDRTHADLSNGALIKTAPEAWGNAGANSMNVLKSMEDGWLSFVADTTSGAFIIGFATDDRNFGNHDLAQGIFVDDNNFLYIAEAGASLIPVGSKVAGDVFRMARTGNTVTYYRNGQLLRTVTVNPVLALRIKSAIRVGSSPRVYASFGVRPLLHAVITPLDAAGTGGAVTVTALHGDAPYTYQWTGGSAQQTITGLFLGTYTATATDASGRTDSKPYDIGFKARWNDPDNVNEVDGSLVKTAAGEGWGNGAHSANRLYNFEDGWLSFVADTTESAYAIGFATDTVNFNDATLAHGIFINADNYIYITEAGVSTLVGTKLPGDVFRIMRAGNQVSFYRNGTALKTATVNPSLTLRIKSAVYYGRSPRVLASFEPPYSETGGVKARWVDHAGVSEYNSILTRTGNPGWSNGANSANLLRANEDGWLEHVIFSNTSRYLIGFTTYSGPYSTETVNYGLSVEAGDSLSVWENSAAGIGLTTWQVGDTLRIERAGNQIIYYRNGEEIRTVSTDQATELRVRAVLYEGTSPAVFVSFGIRLVVMATTITPVKANGTGGGITVEPGHGKQPYTYSWSGGETAPAISDKNTGIYSVTVEDVRGVEQTIPYTVGYRASWTDLTLASNSNGVLTKPSAIDKAWNSGANAYNVLDAGQDGWIEFAIGNTPGNYIIGFSGNTVGTEQERIDHGLAVLEGQKIAAFEKSTVGIPLSSWQPGDVLKIARTGSQVKYYRNGVVLRTAATDPGKQVRVKALVYSGSSPAISVSFDVQLILQANFTPVKSYGLAGGISVVPVTGTPPYTYSWSGGENTQAITNKGVGTYSVTVADAEGRTIHSTYDLGYKVLWTGLVNAAETGGMLGKTTTGGSIGGANSINVLKANEDGWLQFTVDNSISNVSIGFATHNGVFNTAAINHALTVRPGEPVAASEKNWTGFSLGNWHMGDVYKIARAGSQVTYYRNGTALHTVATDPSKEMVIKAAIDNGRLSMVQTSVPVNEHIVTPVDETTVTYTIPKAVKITRDGRLPVEVAAAPPDRFLSQVIAGETKPVFPGCPTGDYYVGFQLLYDLGDKKTTEDWSAFVQLTMFHNEDSLWTRPLRLKMADQTFVATAFYDTTISCDGNYFYHVDFKNLEGNVPDNNIYLKTLLYKRDDAFNRAEKPEVFCPFTAADRERVLRWSHSGNGTLGYDVEWVFIEAHENFTGTTAQEAFGFKEPARITTPFSKYKHQVYYPEGKVWYRVRAVGYDQQYPGRRIPGEWSYPANCATTVACHQPGMNWQQQTVFAEEGKYKKVMNYFDGTLRQRQVQTNLSTKAVTLVGETLYDFEGRSSVSVLAVPATGNSLTYRPGFNMFESTGIDPVVSAYTSGVQHKFHYDNDNLPNSRMDTLSGASRYYSSYNASSSVDKHYIPDAKGYVYSQTEYLNDGTGRVSRQSGVGEEFRTDALHTTRYHYGEAASEELIRLFGSNVGKAEHYKKNAVIDPNGQVSISYLDQEDRVIATALAGKSPGNVDSLKSYKERDRTPVTISIGTKNKKGDGVSTISHKIMNVKQNTPYAFRYDLSAYASDITEYGCEVCTFELKISLSDPDGKTIDLSGFAGSDPANSTDNYIRRNITAASCANPAVVNDIRFTVLFRDIGDYTITKTLTSYDRTFEQMDVLLRQNETIIEKMNAVRNSVVLDSANCEICTSCPEAEQAINEAISEVAEQDCENIHRQMEQDYQEIYEQRYALAHHDSLSEEAFIIPEDTLRLKHPRYCQYELCKKDKASAIFEKRIARAGNWHAADSLGYTNLLAIDSFFNDPDLSGYGSKAAMQQALNNVFVTSLNGIYYSGPIGEVTNPANVSFYIDENGDEDPENGRHLLYLDLMGKRALGMISEAQYQAEVSHSRWALYRGFYMEEKRKQKLAIPAYNGCPAAKQELEQTDEMPTTEEELDEWAEQHGLPDSVTTEQIEGSVASMRLACGVVDFSPEDSDSIAVHLETYFNSNKNNFFKLILKTDLGVNPQLNAIQAILSKYNGCRLDSIALDDPLLCAKDTVIYIEEPDSDNGENTLAMMSASSEEDQPAQDSLLVSGHALTMQEPTEAGAEGQEGLQPLALSTLAVPASLPTQQEYDALMAFYTAMQGPQWGYREGWEMGAMKPDSVQHVYNWYGITVDYETGHITGIKIPNNRLNGPIPPEINNLTELTELDLNNCRSTCNSSYYNNITGFPASLHNLTKLKKLDLYSSGGVLGVSLAHIASSLSNSRDLEFLDLSACGVSSPFSRDIGNFSKLTHLWLLGNPLMTDSIPRSIGKLSVLKDLNLSRCNLIKPIPDSLFTITTLEELDLTDNNFADIIPKGIGNLTNLKKLSLSDNPFNDSIPFSIGKLRKLQQIKISNAQIKNPIPESLWTLPELEYLDMSRNTLKDTIPHSIGKLKAIKTLLLSENLFNDSIPETIGRLKTLEVLYMARCGLTKPLPDSLWRLDHLSALSLEYNPNISDNIPSSIEGLKDLGYLNLEGDKIKGPIPASIGELDKLVILKLNDNWLESLPESIGKLKQLRELELTSNLITDIPDSLGYATNLRKLLLDNNKLADSIPETIGNLRYLETFRVNNNYELKGRLPGSLGNLTSLRDFRFHNNKIKGAIPESFGRLRALWYFLGNNNELESLPDSLGFARISVELNLQSNKLKGAIPDSWTALQTPIVRLSNNQLSGHIPHHLNTYTPAVYLNDNKFIFSDVIDVKRSYDSMLRSSVFIYVPQDTVDAPKTLSAKKGRSITFTAEVDRNTPGCIFRWYKSVDGNYAGAELKSVGYTYTIQSLAESDDGDKYFYTITNSAAAALTLKSHFQTVTVIPPRTLTICTEYDKNNPTLALFTFEIDWNTQVQKCIDNAKAEQTILQELAVEKLMEQEVSEFYNQFRTNCFEHVSENLKYTHENIEHHYTLYYYDQAGNLVQTVPPEGVRLLDTLKVKAVIAGATDEPAHKLTTRYKYTSLNQLAWQRTPDAGESQFWYNEKGQLRLSQNAQQLKDNMYSYTRYDAQGRIFEVGEMNVAVDVTTLRDSLESLSFPRQDNYTLTDITRTHYDFANPGLAEDAGFTQTFLRSRVASVEVIAKDQADTVATYYTYDIHGNVKALLQQLPGLGYKRTDYVYDLVSGKVNYVMYQYDKADEFIHRYCYDADNRIREVYTSSDGFLWDKDAAYAYYHHGPLARQKVGEYGLQRLDYYYTLQGWIKGVNGIGFDPGQDETVPEPDDVFAYNLGYFNNDYTAIGPGGGSDVFHQPMQGYTSLMGDQGLYNGNIAWMATDLKKIGDIKGNPLLGAQAMLYRYDQLHRIIQSRSMARDGATGEFTPRTTAPQAYDEDYSYDANGNLLTLHRLNQHAALKDNFNYSYYQNTNKLKQLIPVVRDTTYEGGAITSNQKVYRKIRVNGNAYVPAGSDVVLKATDSIMVHNDFDVADDASFHAYVLPDDEGVFVYDAIGNLVWDQEEGVKISWTPYGKVREVIKGDTTTIRFRYDGSGNRIEKQIVRPNKTTITRYVRDASGNVMAVYKDAVLIEQSIYGSSRLGLYQGGRIAGHRTLGSRNYEFSNHLGNVLTVISDNIYMNPDSAWTKIISASDYYPFGLAMEDRTYSDTTYRYGFNGKEKDQKGEFGETTYDYGFRIYNPKIAKFLSVDPLTNSYPWYTPYQFAGNKPIWAIDLDGLEEAYYQELLLPNGKKLVINVNDDREIEAYLYQVHKVNREIASIKEKQNQRYSNGEKGTSSISLESGLQAYWEDYWGRTADVLGEGVSFLPIAGSLIEYNDAKINSVVTGDQGRVHAAMFWFAVDLATLGEGSSVVKTAKSAEKTVTLYRAVGQNELADIFQSGLIRPGKGSMETKLFAETFDDALAQGLALNKSFSIIKLEVAESFVEKLFKTNTIDEVITQGRSTFGVPLELVEKFNENIKKFFTTPLLEKAAGGIKVKKQ